MNFFIYLSKCAKSSINGLWCVQYNKNGNKLPYFNFNTTQILNTQLFVRIYFIMNYIEIIMPR